MKQRNLARGLVLGSIFWALLPVAPAHAAPSISLSPDVDRTVQGRIDQGFQVSASTGISHVEVSITQENGTHGPGQVFRDPDDGQPDWCGNPTDQSCFVRDYSGSYSWNTATLTPYNGKYKLTVTAYDHSPGGQLSTKSVYINVNNPPKTPSLGSVRNTGSAESPQVSLSWTYAGTEPDIREFQIERTGPDGQNSVSVLASDASVSGPCSGSPGSTYTCADSVFPSSGYGGTYSYRIWAMRPSPTGPDTSGQPGNCKLDPAGNPYSATGKACIGRGSSSQSVGITEPAPTTGTGGGGGGSGGGGGTVPGDEGLRGAGGTTGFRSPGAGTSILGRNRSRLPGDDDAFFTSGAYDEKLPYQPRNLLSPNGTSSGNNGTREVASGSDNPVGLPLKDRSLLLPLAAGLLLSLGAVHVKRLLADR